MNWYLYCYCLGLHCLILSYCFFPACCVTMVFRADADAFQWVAQIDKDKSGILQLKLVIILA